MTDSVYFGDMMRTLHEILDELKLMNKKLDKLIGEK
jgi:mevalonate kinase